MLLLMRVELVVSFKTRKNSPKAVKDQERTISSHLKARGVQQEVLTLILEIGRTFRTANI
jgi:hypothetical protein